MSLGICKLHNLGNTCYMNTIFQVLLHTPELIHIINNAKPYNITVNRDEYDVVYYWKELAKTAHTSKNILTISPRSLVQCIRKVSSKYSDSIGSQQQDAGDFLLLLMEVFHIALTYPVKMNNINPYQRNTARADCFNRLNQLYTNKYSDIIKFFYGMTITEIVDKHTYEVVSRTFDPYFILNVPVNNQQTHPTIYDCLNTLLNVEVLEPNTWFNTNTKRYQDVIKSTKLWFIPSVLVIHLKTYPIPGRSYSKIDIPHQLNLRKYVHDNIPLEHNYKLYAVCNHIGTLDSGHYYSYVYVDSIQSWVVFNDSQTPTRLNADSVITPNAVCMFYRKI